MGGGGAMEEGTRRRRSHGERGGGGALELVVLEEGEPWRRRSHGGGEEEEEPWRRRSHGGGGGRHGEGGEEEMMEERKNEEVRRRRRPVGYYIRMDPLISGAFGNLVRLRELQICFKDCSFDLYEGFVKSLCNLHCIESLCIGDACREGPSPELMDLLGELWVPPVHIRIFMSWMPIQLSALRGLIKRDPSHLSNLSELILWEVKEVQQEDMEIVGGLLSLRRLRIRSTHQTQRLLVIGADGFRCMVDFHLNCGSAAQIMFEPEALPKVETVCFSLGVRVGKEDGNYGFDLGLQGHRFRQYVCVDMRCGGVMVGEAKQAEAAVTPPSASHRLFLWQLRTAIFT